MPSVLINLLFWIEPLIASGARACYEPEQRAEYWFSLKWSEESQPGGQDNEKPGGGSKMR